MILKKIKRQIANKIMYAISRMLWKFYDKQSLVGTGYIIENKYFPVIKEMEDNWKKIRDELFTILEYRKHIPFFHEISTENSSISKGGDWKTFGLHGFQYKYNDNCSLAPYTTSLLDKIPNLRTSFFSILAPGAHILPHKGHTRGILTAHLCLTLPKNNKGCALRINNKNLYWKKGKIFIFDDTYEHEAWNKTDEERVVLLFNFDRPMKKLGHLIHDFTIKIFLKSEYMKSVQRNMKRINNKMKLSFKI